MTEFDYLRSLGHDRILHMISAVSIPEPERISRTGTVLILDINLNTSQPLEWRLTREGYRVLQPDDKPGETVLKSGLSLAIRPYRRCVCGDDMVARFGGDEFCIILHHVTNRKRVEMLVNHILQSVSEPYIRNDVTMRVLISINIGLYALKIHDSEDLPQEADTPIPDVCGEAAR